MICIKWQLYVFFCSVFFCVALVKPQTSESYFWGIAFIFYWCCFYSISFFISICFFFSSIFSHAMPILFCKRKFTNQTSVITFINLENRLFELVCPFGGKNRRILHVYKLLIISEIRFNIHFAFSLSVVFYHLLPWFWGQKLIFVSDFFRPLRSKKITSLFLVANYKLRLIVYLQLLTLR